MDEPDYSDGTEPNLRGWHQTGRDMGASHMIVAFDTGYDFQPVYVIPGGESL